MKAYVVYVTYDDGSSEGVMFTDRNDAIDALNGVQQGSALAVDWSELIADNDTDRKMIEIELPSTPHD